MAEYNKAQLTEMIVGKLLRNFGRTVDEATPNHMFKACAMVLRDIMSGHQIETSNHVWEAQGRQVHYLSLEFLMGRSLEKNAYNLGLLDTLTCSRPSQTPAWAMAVWVVWPPATWTP